MEFHHWVVNVFNLGDFYHQPSRLVVLIIFH